MVLASAGVRARRAGRLGDVDVGVESEARLGVGDGEAASDLIQDKWTRWSGGVGSWSDRSVGRSGVESLGVSEAELALAFEIEEEIDLSRSKRSGWREE
ncbi:uncharacterized protein A4U43_C01F17710 [Asparagus officinalis]|uniref:Uncharacterized protein n=1 Tax=Asparagus officinalis TaxID=4686 RepID=A0A5P1FSN1_ASPOF|nr:uncharacterized protein A4U43_C01F17710 [Asparagus officinalis]